MGKRLAAALAALTALMLIPASAPAKMVAGVDVRPGCDFIGAAVCQLPWPNDYFTKLDKSTDTGVRLALTKSAMPRNKKGKPIDPADMNRADGQPRQRDARKGAWARYSGGGAAQQAAAAHRPEPGSREALAHRRDQRAHREAASDLGRDRLEREAAGRPPADRPARA